MWSWRTAAEAAPLRAGRVPTAAYHARNPAAEFCRIPDHRRMSGGEPGLALGEDFHADPLRALATGEQER
ncbi:hypothetical protein MDOR_04190 [Mycolicibacterium doricum]|uniref:Uncharacterized protein n=2 Tax=Mycolicibacterium doricum TaxID=126673 RepID=A0A7I7VMG5_9MYCO|nr:hypothetical protein MDOR_04190 [Mycolicibacterium doricum]